jgi:2-oxoglutarate ferredoxin oxidoreductase subunit alpha
VTALPPATALPHGRIAANQRDAPIAIYEVHAGSWRRGAHGGFASWDELAATLPAPEVFGDDSGDVLLVGWGSTFGPVREALGRLRQNGTRAAQLHLRHLSPLPQGLEEVFKRYRDIIVVEMNDEGLYGYGQMASLLRARYANPAIRSLTKTDGLTFRVSEIVSGVTQRLTAAATA